MIVDIRDMFTNHHENILMHYGKAHVKWRRIFFYGDARTSPAIVARGAANMRA